MTSELEVARELAVRAGELIVGYFGRNLPVDMKGWADPVTVADREAEALIRRELTARFPDDAIHGEEQGYRPGRSGRVWVVDPLDGTANFAGGMPIFCVCITLLDDRGTPVVNVTHDPMQHETFHATRGGGAYLNDVPIHASDCDQVSAALIHLNWPRDRALWMASLELARRITAIAPHSRNIGSSALSQAYVACGRLHAQVRAGAGEFDIIGGNLLIEEAGGVVTDLAGGAFSVACGGLLAACRPLHGALLALDLASTLQTDD